MTEGLGPFAVQLPWGFRFNGWRGDKGESQACQEKEHDHFAYDPLERSETAIRLIRFSPLTDTEEIHGELVTTYSTEANYTCLSYVWGDDEPTKIIQLDSKVFHVRSNLYCFLRSIVQYQQISNRLYWIDAICINQTDIAERNYHVRHMGSVYYNASQVVAWLGVGNIPFIPHGPHLHGQGFTCCENFTYAEESGEQHECLWREPDEMTWELFMHEYWNRMWVVQEVALARRVQILCRNALYEWSEVRSFLTSAIADSREHESTRDHPFWGDIRFLETLAFSRHLEVTASTSLGEMAPKFAFQDCRVPHDHVFALLSMASDGADFEPDYAESRVSLLLRVLTFCKFEPNRNHTAKLSFALRLDPYKEGVRIDMVGRVMEVSGDSPIGGLAESSAYPRYQSIDINHKPICEGDTVACIPDTSLYLLFRPQKADENGRPSCWTFVTRVEAVHDSLEHVDRPVPKHVLPAWIKENWRRFREARLKCLGQESQLRLVCDDQLILGIFHFSETEAAPGSLASQRRVWTPFSEAGHEHAKFTVRR